MAMFEKREDLNLGDDQETIVGQSVKLKGNLKSNGNIKVAGQVTGEVDAKGNVVVGKTATLEAKVSGANITISGVLKGNITASGQLEITQTGQVMGDVECETLIVQPGGILIGRSNMVLKEEKPSKKEAEKSKDSTEKEEKGEPQKESAEEELEQALGIEEK